MQRKKIRILDFEYQAGTKGSYKWQDKLFKINNTSDILA